MIFKKQCIFSFCLGMSYLIFSSIFMFALTAFRFNLSLINQEIFLLILRQIFILLIMLDNSELYLMEQYRYKKISDFITNKFKHFIVSNGIFLLISYIPGALICVILKQTSKLPAYVGSLLLANLVSGIYYLFASFFVRTSYARACVLIIFGETAITLLSQLLNWDHSSLNIFTYQYQIMTGTKLITASVFSLILLLIFYILSVKQITVKKGWV